MRAPRRTDGRRGRDRGRLAAACLATVAASLAGVASAQPKKVPELDGHVPIGSHIKQDPEQIVGDDLDRFFDRMATCVVARSAERTDHFLRNSDDFGIADAIDDVSDFLPLPTCVGKAASAGSLESQARFTPRLLRNWLSEKAYLAGNSAFVAVPADAAPVPQRAYFTPAALMQAQGFGAFSDCIVRQDAAGADALLRTARATVAEREAAKALVPAMADCLPADLTLTLNPGSIRGFAAQGLWQRYEAPKPARYKAAR